MNLVTLIDFLRDRLGLVIKACIGLLIALCAFDAYRLLGGHGHEAVAETAEHVASAASSEAAHAAKEGFWQSLYHISETWPIFWSVFGFIACVLIVYVSKGYGHSKIGNTEIMTREDYYNE